ncbi:MAG: hypothetical protein EBZ48_11350 [Proteobacteria bacterium]|nr:hypothetical protein [Pseudomonadota bacterium]
MPSIQNLFRTTLIIAMACAVVGIGAEELHRKTRTIKVSEESGKRMMKLLNPEQDFKSGASFDRSHRSQESEAERAQLRTESASPAESEAVEHLDPTGLRSLLRKLTP